jgi:uncharacterized protein YbbK (DUF523 family)
MEKILISACLLGQIVRYDGKEISLENPQLKRWHKEGRLITVCPEVNGGLPVPRPAAEIINGEGRSVLSGRARLQTINGTDVTENFLKGAFDALTTARQFDIKIAILKENSPSCGSSFIYDGTFSGTKKPGKGVTTALLEENGIRVFNENEIREAATYLNKLETGVVKACIKLEIS